MPELSDLIQEADWKKEKHAPAIECAEEVQADQMFEVKLTLGKEIAHPNTTEHHIRWISLYFLAEGEKLPHHVGHCEFAAHGESTQGPNQGPVFTHHAMTLWMKTSKPGLLYALALCNIHGLWQSCRPVRLAG